MPGATYIVHRHFDAEAFIDTVERERVTHTMLVPSQIVAILNARGFDPARLVSLEMLLSLGAPLSSRHKARLQRLLPDRFYELYGLTEGFVTILDRDDALSKAGSVGVPPPFYEMKSSATMAANCRRIRRARSSAAGRSRYPATTVATTSPRRRCVTAGSTPATLATVDDDGYLYLVDRKKDMIDSGGVKVYPKDIEEVVAGIRTCARSRCSASRTAPGRDPRGGRRAPRRRDGRRRRAARLDQRPRRREVPARGAGNRL